MDYFLAQATENVDRGLEQQARGKPDRARYHYLRAAEFLFKAAQRSEGELRRIRTESAEELLQRARALEGKVAAATPPEVRPAESIPAGAAGGEPWLVAERPKVRFDDVAGLEAVKEEIRLRMVYPFTHPRAADRYGTRKGGGLLLYGPPGTGKTLLARAVAGEIDAAFFTVKPSDVMSKWVGEAEQNVAKLFAAARAHERAVIFLDEVEALIPARRGSGSTVMQRVVPQVLAEMEGFEQRKGALLFIGATNEPWALDSAVLRPGRFDEKVYVPLPDRPARLKILELNLAGRPLAREVRPTDLAETLEGYSGADLVHICRKACDLPFLEAVKTGQERDVSPRDFLTVLHEVKPSVSPKDLARFEEFARSG